MYRAPDVNSSILIDISQLRVGMYIQLDVGWLHHPFPTSSFRVASSEQIATLRELGLTEVRYVPKKSDPALQELVPAAWSVPEMTAPSPNGLDAPGPGTATVVDPEVQRRRELLEAQNRALAACNQRFSEATRQYQSMERTVSEHPDQARAKGEALVSGCVTELLENGDSVIRLLSEGVGERNGLHPINVMVISLLLGRSLGMKSEELHDLGVAALIHDIGKLKLPPNLRQPTPSMIPMERSRYETHVGESVAFAKRMELPDSVVTAIARHHEMADGSGLSAWVDNTAVPRLPGVEHYLAEGCVPGGTGRNFDSYGDKVAPITEAQKQLLCDPQTSGGLLVAVAPEGEDEFLSVAAELGLKLAPIGQLTERQRFSVEVR